MIDPLGTHGIYLAEKFGEAVRLLVTGRGTINRRLVAAGKLLIQIPETGLPTVDGVDERIRAILARFTSGPRYPDVSLPATSMRGIKEGPALAAQILDTWFMLDGALKERSARWSAELELARSHDRHPPRAAAQEIPKMVPSAKKSR